ncbi:MAG TPA: DUF4350 domain-containing protein [Coleofasciculaceae cyanobacterium]
MNLSNRRLWLLGAIAIGAIIVITLLAAPANNKLNNGSTYNRAPEGYGAWYAFMSERGTPVQRWRKPFEDLAKNKNAKQPVTLLRIYSPLTIDNIYGKERDWVESGNTLVALGVRQPVTNASFSTRLNSPAGSVKIDTQRRAKDIKNKLLGDRFGAIVWEESIGKGRVIFATTPYLAANAYQDFQGNYEFLAQLVTQSGAGEQASNGENPIQNTVWVDEYIHGYKDSDVIKREQGGNVFSYLAKTPVFPIFVQGLILLLIAIGAGNRRFGKPVTLSTPAVDNSEAYIQALAGVLQKANSSEFILDVVGKEEQLQLQKALFLGQEQLDHQSLVNAWVQQTGRPATELEQLLQMQSRKRRMSETDLLSWLGKWEQIRRHLPS